MRSLKRHQRWRLPVGAVASWRAATLPAASSEAGVRSAAQLSTSPAESDLDAESGRAVIPAPPHPALFDHRIKGLAAATSLNFPTGSGITGVVTQNLLREEWDPTAKAAPCRSGMQQCTGHFSCVDATFDAHIKMPESTPSRSLFRFGDTPAAPRTPCDTPIDRAVRTRAPARPHCPEPTGPTCPNQDNVRSP